MTVKGLTTPLSRWLRGSCLFVQVLGTCVLPPTRLIPWFSKTEGQYLRYFVASPFPLQGKTNACSRGSKKDFWRHCLGDLHSSQDIPSTHHKLLSIALHYLQFASRFALPHFTLAVFFALLPFDLVSPCAFYVLASLLAKNLLI